jgi:nitrite reductase/ring-hydroxylating ferredoxin subunit
MKLHVHIFSENVIGKMTRKKVPIIGIKLANIIALMRQDELIKCRIHVEKLSLTSGGCCEKEP